MKQIKAIHIALPTLLATTTFGDCCMTKSSTMTVGTGFQSTVNKIGTLLLTTATYQGPLMTLSSGSDWDIECGSTQINRYNINAPQFGLHVTTTSMYQENTALECDFIRTVASAIYQAAPGTGQAFAAWYD